MKNQLSFLFRTEIQRAEQEVHDILALKFGLSIVQLSHTYKNNFKKAENKRVK